MKTLPLEALQMLQGRAPVIGAAAKLVFSPSEIYRYWSGFGTIQIDGEDYEGLGARALIAPHQSQIGGAADGLVITLSKLEPAAAAAVEGENYHQKPITIRRLIFAPNRKTLLGSAVFMRGRIDTISQRHKVGEYAAIDVSVEGPRRDMGRSGGRLASNADQRVLGGAGDASLKHVSSVARKTLNWGNRPSTVGGGRSGFGLLGIIRVGFAPHVN